VNKPVAGESRLFAATESRESFFTVASVREQRKFASAFRKTMAVSVEVADVKVYCDPAK
jgi:hypothetical protein